jgi:[ribosomal protein S5]-alanine N-acetyltransferase
MTAKKIAMGKRVFLSRPASQDMTDFLEAIKTSQTLHHPWVTPPSDEEKYFAYLKRTNTESHQGFLIKCNATCKLVGVVNINEIVRGAFQSGYLGYYAFSDFEGKGLMAEGFSLVVSHAFNILGLHRLEANIQPDNTRSINFIKKQAFRLEGFSPQYLKINGQWRDHKRFAITSD